MNRVLLILFLFSRLLCFSQDLVVVSIDVDFTTDIYNCPNIDYNLSEKFIYDEYDANPFTIKGDTLIVDSNYNKERIKDISSLIIIKKSDNSFDYIPGISKSANVYISYIENYGEVFKLFSYSKLKDENPILIIKSSGHINPKPINQKIKFEEKADCGISKTELVLKKNNINCVIFTRSLGYE